MTQFNMIRLMTRRLMLLLSILLTPTILRAYDPAVDQLLSGSMIYSGNETKAALAFD